MVDAVGHSVTPPRSQVLSLCLPVPDRPWRQLQSFQSDDSGVVEFPVSRDKNGYFLKAWPILIRSCAPTHMMSTRVVYRSTRYLEHLGALESAGI